MPVEGFSGISRPIRTWLYAGEEILSSNLIRESNRAFCSEDQLIDVLGGSRQYPVCHLDIQLVEVCFLGLIAFRLGGQGEEFVGDKAGAHQQRRSATVDGGLKHKPLQNSPAVRSYQGGLNEVPAI